MKYRILEIYAMFVCFPAVICLTVVSSIGLFDLVQIFFPELTAGTSGKILLERQFAIQSLVKILTVFPVTIIVLSIHWSIGKRAREARAS